MIIGYLVIVSIIVGVRTPDSDGKASESVNLIANDVPTAQFPPK